ncbi:FRG domain-containing protein [Priestia aryabhattai]|uniref:FRG domain-containing protein n=1 Tax=Priestia aryabhattai TaxID=412384 RepID=UPI003D2A84F4
MSDKLNTDFKKHIVRNFNDYLEILREIKKDDENVWFRGQSNASYRLVPSAMRDVYTIKDQFDRPKKPVKLTEYNNRGDMVAYVDVAGMLEEFKKLAKPYFRIQPNNDLEWYFLAQHYGIPTTLLDWSTDPLVALFFAMPEKVNLSSDDTIKDSIEDFQENSYSDKGAAVFVINPGKMNEICTFYKVKKTDKFIDFPLDATEHYNLISTYLPGSCEQLLPCCITSTPIDKRICRQSGNFTIHGNMVWPLDHQNVTKSAIHKIFIPYQCIKEMKEILDVLDINKRSIYGDSELDAITKNISKESEKNLKLAIEELKGKYQESLVQ